MSRLFRDVDGGPRCPHGSVVCIGAFDGLHLGHRALVRHAVARARALDVPAVALTFEPLPREFFAGGHPPPRLLSARAKVEGLLALGADQVGLLRFDARMASMTAADFVRTVLVDHLAVREVWVGPGFRFGKGRAGDLALLRSIGSGLADSGEGFTAHEIEPVVLDGERVSSTRIRAALQAGDFAGAARMLGRPFAIGGRVARGRRGAEAEVEHPEVIEHREQQDPEAVLRDAEARDDDRRENDADDDVDADPGPAPEDIVQKGGARGSRNRSSDFSHPKGWHQHGWCQPRLGQPAKAVFEPR